MSETQTAQKSQADKFLILTSLLVLIIVIAREPLVWELNYYSPGIFFVMIPILLASMALTLLGPILWLIVAFLRRKRRGLLKFVPFVISMVTLAAAEFQPGTDWWLRYNDFQFATEREEFWQQASKGSSLPQGYYGGIQTISYPEGRNLSIGGEPAFYKMTPDGLLILYLTFTGIPDGMSGFLYAPIAIDPKTAWPELDLEWSDVWDNSRHIYFVGNR